MLRCGVERSALTSPTQKQIGEGHPPPNKVEKFSQGPCRDRPPTNSKFEKCKKVGNWVENAACMKSQQLARFEGNREKSRNWGRKASKRQMEREIQRRRNLRHQVFSSAGKLYLLQKRTWFFLSFFFSFSWNASAADQMYDGMGGLTFVLAWLN